jgi:hypothetical protein
MRDGSAMSSYLGLGDGLGLGRNGLSLEFLDGSARGMNGRSVPPARVDMSFSTTYSVTGMLTVLTGTL